MDSDLNTRLIYFVGQNLGHAVTNQIHDIIAEELALPWKLRAIDSPSLDEFSRAMRAENFGGAVVTIPHKISIMHCLDRIDDMGSLLGACNNVYKSPDGLLTGTNTDWIGVRDSLLQLARQPAIRGVGADPLADGEIPGFGKPGFVIGSGGAARAAVYTLHKVFGASKVYIVNRDNQEVEALASDITKGYEKSSIRAPDIIHLRRREDVASADDVFYGVGTVPDLEPTTPEEIQARSTLESLLDKNNGVFLDMCYKPRVTRNLLLTSQKGWATGEGGQVVAWQLKAQWKLWAGEEISEAIPLDRMIEHVQRIIERLP